MDAFWIILTGCLVAIPCAMLGCFLVLRKTVMIGDAISHAVLPGIVIAYMITQTFDSVTMMLGAAVLGFVTTFLVEFFQKKGNLQADAAIGVTFTGLFAVGIILISSYTRDVDLDQDCVLYGEIIDVPYRLSEYIEIPTPVILLLAVNLIVVLFVGLGYKELKITAFDNAFAKSIGMATAVWHYALMGIVSFVTVASFESVGAILVVAFLVAPAAAAYLLTKKLFSMIALAVCFGVLSAVGGFLFAEYIIDTATSAAMATVAGIIFVLALFLSPDQGILFRKSRTRHKNVKETF